MTDVVQLVPLDERSAASVASWFEDDDQGSREFGGSYGKHPTWWSLVEADDDRHGFVAHVAGQPIGFVDLEVLADRSAHVSIYVRREVRGRGLGGQLVRALPELAARLGVATLRGAIDPGNVASLAVARRAGGIEDGHDEYGYVQVRGSL